MFSLFKFKSFLARLGLALTTFLLVTVVVPGFAADRPPGDWGTKTQIPVEQPPAETQAPVRSATLLTQGKNQFEAGRLSEAAQFWQKAAQTYQTQGDRLNQALSLSYLSLAYQHLGQWDQAEQSISQSLDLLQYPRGAAGDRTIETAIRTLETPHATVLAQTLNTQGGLQLAMGHPQQALETWQQATVAYRQLEDETGVLGSQVNQAQAFQTMGLYRRAQRLLEDLNQDLKRQPASPLKATGLRSLGNLLQVVGDYQQSEQVLEESLAIARQFELPSDISAALFGLGNTYRSAQQFNRALQFYQQAAATAPNTLQQIEAQTNQLSLLVETHRIHQAQRLFAQLRTQLKTLSPSRTSIYARVNLAESWLKLESNPQFQSTATVSSDLRVAGLSPQGPAISTPDIAQLLAGAVRQARELQDGRAESFALGQLGTLYEVNRQWADAEDLTRQALALAQVVNAQDIAYRWQWQLGRILGHQNQTDGAISAYEKAIDTLRPIRGDLIASNSDVQFSFRERIEPVYREMVQILLQPEKPGQEPSQANLREARAVIEELQLAELEDFFRSACIDAQPQRVDDLDPNAAVFYPIILPDSLEVVLALQNKFHHFQIPVAQPELETTVNQLLQTFSPAASDQQRLTLSTTIYDWLIRKAEPFLVENQIETLVFVLDGNLRNLPIAGLYDGQQYLIEKYGVALTPGLQLLESRGPLKSGQAQALMLGLTQARQGFPPLPEVGTEVKQISAKLSAEVFLDQAFTKETLAKQLRTNDAPIIHLATHGQFSSSLQDTFLLAWDQKIHLSEMDDLLRLRPDAHFTAIELLVLSACQTATGDERATLGLAGLAVQSGARSTLATLWSVQDDSTAQLMTEFYRALLKPNASKAEGLRQAQMVLLKKTPFRHPYYWAPFVLVGNWL